MRRPRFYRWIKLRVLEIAGTDSFNLRSFAAKAQQEPTHELAAALLLYAHENECTNRLFSFIHDEDLLKEYHAIESRFGWRSIERLALRGTPMMSLPETYRSFLSAYEVAYHEPERIAAQKKALSDQAREAVIYSGIAPATIAADLGLDLPNLNAFIMRGETHRVNVDTARDIVAYVASAHLH